MLPGWWARLALDNISSAVPAEAKLVQSSCMGSADNNTDLIQALSGSGFPMQTAVASAIKGLCNYEVEQELAWHHPDSSDGFLDIAAVGREVHVLIECKKTVQDKFIFLLPEDSDFENQQSIQGIYLHQSPDSTRRPAVVWGRISAIPVSYKSMFCVAKSSKSPNSNRLLESYVQPLVKATEAYALERYRRFRPAQNEPRCVPCIPLLITNAPLFVAQYRPEDVCLESGIYKARTEHINSVKYIRFHKQFTTSFEVEMRERTVLVAHTSAIAEVLNGLASANVVDAAAAKYIVLG